MKEKETLLCIRMKDHSMHLVSCATEASTGRVMEHIEFVEMTSRAAHIPQGGLAQEKVVGGARASKIVQNRVNEEIEAMICTYITVLLQTCMATVIHHVPDHGWRVHAGRGACIFTD